MRIVLMIVLLLAMTMPFVGCAAPTPTVLEVVREVTVIAPQTVVVPQTVTIQQTVLAPQTVQVPVTVVVTQTPDPTSTPLPPTATAMPTKPATPIPTALATPVQSGGVDSWPEYIDPKGRFTVRYPPGWIVGPAAVAGVTILAPNDQYQSTFSFMDGVVGRESYGAVQVDNKPTYCSAVVIPLAGKAQYVIGYICRVKEWPEKALYEQFLIALRTVRLK